MSRLSLTKVFRPNLTTVSVQAQPQNSQCSDPASQVSVQTQPHKSQCSDPVSQQSGMTWRRQQPRRNEWPRHRVPTGYQIRHTEASSHLERKWVGCQETIIINTHRRHRAFFHSFVSYWCQRFMQFRYQLTVLCLNVLLPGRLLVLRTSFACFGRCHKLLSGCRNTSGLPATWRRDMTAIVFTRFSTASFVSHSSFFEHTKRQWSAAVLWWYAILHPQCSTVSSTSACPSHRTPSDSHREAFSIQSSHISKVRSSVCRFPGFAYLSLCQE